MNIPCSSSKVTNLILLALLWGPTALIMKIGVEIIHPITFIAFTSLIASLFLFIGTNKTEIKFINKDNIKHSTIVGLLAYTIPFATQAYAIQNIPSIWVGVVVSIIPIFTACMAHFIIPNERITPKHIIGLGFGLAGFFLLFNSASYEANTSQETISLFLVLFSVFCCACGLIYAKKNKQHLPSSSSPLLQFVSSSIILLPASFLVDSNITVFLSSTNAIFLILAYGIPCTAIAFFFYYKLVNTASTTFIAMVNYLLPIIKTILGVLFLHEVMDLSFIASIVFILAGLKIINSLESSTSNSVES